MTSQKGPSKPTIKRLFAESKNRCAFPKCRSALVDPQSGSIIGVICHIKGHKPTAARYNSNQSDEERHSFDNLLLLCGAHHKVIDDDEITYTVDRIRQIKNDHEIITNNQPEPPSEVTERFVSAMESSTINADSAVISHHQSGGQTAHLINNYYGPRVEDETVRLETKLDIASDIKYFSAFGCPGVRVTVICRSQRQAKIHCANLLIDGVDMMSKLNIGFGTDFGFTPVEGAKQMLVVQLVPLSKPQAQEGYVLNRDDVCRFFYPLPLSSTLLAIRAKPEDLSLSITMFDNSEQLLLSGDEVQQPIKNLYDVYHKRAGHFKGQIQFGVRTLSKTRPTIDAQGKVNQNYIPINDPD